MSLLFESAIGDFDLSTATLYPPADGDLEATRDEPVPIDGIVEYASHHDRLDHPEKDDWIVIPLHESDSAALTGEYIAFTDHALHGEIFVYDGGDDYESIDRDAFVESTLAGRVRFWHSDYAPDDPPSYFDSPIAEREPPRQPLSDDDAASFFDELESFVRAEMEAQRDVNREKAAGSTPEELHRRGFGAIPSLSSLGHPEDGIYRFRIDDDDGDDRSQDRYRYVQREFGIFEGNEVRLVPPSAEHAPEAFPIAATVDSIEGRTVRLAVDWHAIEDRSTVGGYLRQKRRGFAMTLLLNPVPYDRELEAIARVRERDDHRALLTGETAVTFGDTAGVKSSQQDVELNQEQELAVSCALLADHLFCIHGPPGTGKTRTLVEVVRRSVEAGDDVLVCADSNQAVDNLVAGSSTAATADERSLHAYAQHGADEFVLRRVNAGNSSNDVVSERYATCDGRADVVAATNSSAATLDREFDVLVLDEATQATCTASCIPLARANKVVLAGDHKQLPPFSATEDPPESAAGMSLFEHLYADGGVYEGVGVQLRTQYRMHRDIAWFSNRRFYDRALRQGRDVTSLEDQPALVGYDVGGSEETIDHSKRNDAEARLVAHVVDELRTEAGLEASDIGVITPYTAQVDAVRTKLTTRLERGREVTVDTIDSFQGSEKVAIVISLVRSNADGEVGFLDRPLDGPRRLNVAMTRAERFCAIVGDWYTLRGPRDGTRSGTDLYDDLHSFLESTGRLRQVEPEFIPAPE
ncbi:Superfamily I DNA and RNA helicase and helicase subunits-like protein (plasmid) [Haloterrigena turkmenica DSM 5511]|uniref:Superfamily I DNA and RNA helicase and helicase subunits-like protein n=1 Tax=Haloterrigena turkmenica (strain ATCC 51198 / DSM 5511 / JCM 9101 / NCIMB 13204 / VKM B-1734 / 4k) TaxID=543526 RepID=D2S1A2_HALTV|nr:AAA domain-containing protein [Haloterrigena turkmenica]ADB63149.1 Superfamily I DNA and RNA helicase and helicase subunits-like protein [Haloterrigena turkmenica DSM 5511]